jgi:hypothetical protein
MSFYQVIQILKSNCETIKTIQLIYNDKVNFCLNCADMKNYFKIITKGSYQLRLYVEFDQ